MINRIIGFFFIGALFIALLLALSGFTEPIGTDRNFYYFISILSNYFKDTESIKIPEIQKIPTFSEDGQQILNVLKNIANVFIVIVNILSTLTNIGIQLIFFIVHFIRAVVTYVDFVRSGQPISINP